MIEGEEFNRMYLPELIKLRAEGHLSPDHQVNELLDRWDPDTETLLPEE